MFKFQSARGPDNPQRRRFLFTGAGMLATAGLRLYARHERPASAAGQLQDDDMPPKNAAYPIKAIASANGLQATKKAYALLGKNADTLEAAIDGVNVVEDDPDDTTVGYGGLPNEEGVVELDAAVMHGPTHRAGAVAALRNIRYPARVARLVLERSDHVLLVGDGALQFAKAHGFQEENLLSDKARKIWLYWKETLSPRDDWLPPAHEELDADVAKFFNIPEPTGKQGETEKPAGSKGKPQSAGPRKLERPTGTVHCATMNARGDMSCLTSTSGLAFKMPGRIGDSPIIGAGLYVDNEVGSCGSTGRGEANLQNCSCFAAVELMRNGWPPREAGLDVLSRIARSTTESRLLDDEGRPNFNLRLYLLAKNGDHAGVSLWGPSKIAVTDAQGARLEECAFLYERKTG